MAFRCAAEMAISRRNRIALPGVLRKGIGRRSALRGATNGGRWPEQWGCEALTGTGIEGFRFASRGMRIPSRQSAVVQHKKDIRFNYSTVVYLWLVAGGAWRELCSKWGVIQRFDDTSFDVAESNEGDITRPVRADISLFTLSAVRANPAAGGAEAHTLGLIRADSPCHGTER